MLFAVNYNVNFPSAVPFAITRLPVDPLVNVHLTPRPCNRLGSGKQSTDIVVPHRVL